jgi:hypothetical protein
MASGLHLQHIADFNYSGGSFEIAREGDLDPGISMAFGLYPQQLDAEPIYNKHWILSLKMDVTINI